MQTDVLFMLAVLIFSTILHELAHGYMANALGDPTARLAGRLTINPIPHIDLFGSIIFPLLLKLTGSPILIGYAKPVPYNPYNLRGRWGEALVAAAGPMANIVLAVLFGLLARWSAAGVAPAALPPLADAFASIAYLNLMLALFNLIPIPPLDGSKVLSEILPGSLGRAYERFRFTFERFGVLTGVFIILILFTLLAPFFSLLLEWVFHLLTGL